MGCTWYDAVCFVLPRLVMPPQRQLPPPWLPRFLRQEQTLGTPLAVAAVAVVGDDAVGFGANSVAAVAGLVGVEPAVAGVAETADSQEKLDIGLPRRRFAVAVVASEEPVAVDVGFAIAVNAAAVVEVVVGAEADAEQEEQAAAVEGG